MIPKSFSASALQTAEDCLVRYKALHVDYIAQEQNAAANVGTAVHGALEHYVKAVYIDKIMKPQCENLELYYHQSFLKTFGHSDDHSPEYKDGLALCQKWFVCHDLDDDEVEVLSVEIKKSFDVPVKLKDGSTQRIKFNYIIDRVDKIGENQYRVVDYKTIRIPMSHEDLRTKIQPLVYALALQIEYKDAEEIQVQFDLLRHSPVIITLKKAEQVRTWKRVRESAQRIIDAENPKPTLNSGCRFCPIKLKCSAFTSNITFGGIHSVTLDEAAVLLETFRIQEKNAKQAILELEGVLTSEAINQDSLRYETDNRVIEITASRRRAIDSEAAGEVLGPDIMKKYGTLRMGDVDELLKGNDITQDQKDKIHALIYYNFGEAKPKIKKKV